MIDLSHLGQVITANIDLDAGHEIFKGHYPGQPVLPGACMLQILKEILEAALGFPIVLSSAPQIKFLNMVDPNRANNLTVDINYKLINDNLVVKASVTSEKTITFKFSGSFKQVVSA